MQVMGVSDDHRAPDTSGHLNASRNEFDRPRACAPPNAAALLPGFVDLSWIGCCDGRSPV
jgi:hypothetical protein